MELWQWHNQTIFPELQFHYSLHVIWGPGPWIMCHLIKDCFIMVRQEETKVNLPFSVNSGITFYLEKLNFLHLQHSPITMVSDFYLKKNPIKLKRPSNIVQLKDSPDHFYPCGNLPHRYLKYGWWHPVGSIAVTRGLMSTPLLHGEPIVKFQIFNCFFFEPFFMNGWVLVIGAI